MIAYRTAGFIGSPALWKLFRCFPAGFRTAKAGDQPEIQSVRH